MDIKANVGGCPESVLVSLSSESPYRLADLVVAKLTAKNEGILLPEQDVEGSNPFTRSRGTKRRLYSQKRTSGVYNYG